MGLKNCQNNDNAVFHGTCTWPVNKNVTFFFTLQPIIGCSVSLPANMLVLFISFYSSHVKGNYKYFIANMSFCNILYVSTVIFASCSHLYHRLFDVQMNVNNCTLESEIPYAAGLCLGFAMPLTSINRFYVIVKDKNDWFTLKNTIFICLTSYIPLVYPAIVFAFAFYYEPYYSCGYRFYIPYFVYPFFAYVIFIAYPALMFCNFRIYRMLSKHMQTVASKLRLTPQQIENERSILKAIVIQGAIPVVLALPFGIMCMYIGIINSRDWGILTGYRVFHFNDYFQLCFADLLLLFFYMTPIADAFITLLVVKQYKEAYKEIRNKIAKKICCCSIQFSTEIE